MDMEFKMPLEIQTILNSNLDKFASSVYLEEEKTDICEYLSKNLVEDFPFFNLKYNNSYTRRDYEIDSLN